MKEFIEKLIGRLEEARQECQKLQKTTTDAYGYMKQKQGIDVAKEIVNELAEEFATDINVVSKNGWIPCSERLPELGQACLLNVNRRNYPYAEHDVIFCSCVHAFHLSRFNDWCTAWQPLPEPYKS